MAAVYFQPALRPITLLFLCSALFFYIVNLFRLFFFSSAFWIYSFIFFFRQPSHRTRYFFVVIFFVQKKNDHKLRIRWTGKEWRDGEWNKTKDVNFYLSTQKFKIWTWKKNVESPIHDRWHNSLSHSILCILLKHLNMTHFMRISGRLIDERFRFSHFFLPLERFSILLLSCV